MTAHVPGPTTDRVGRRVAPLLAGYWAFGQYWGVWVILVVEFQHFHGMSDSRLGLWYSFLSLAAVAVMLVGAPRLRGLALGASVPLSLALLGAAAVFTALQPTSLVFVGGALVGFGNGLIDVYVNVAAQRQEVLSRRPVLQWLHAAYAFGGVTGALLAGVVLSLGVDFRVGIVASGLALLATALWNRMRAPEEPAVREAGPLLSIAALFRSPMLWAPAIVILSTFLVEGSMDTWSGKYLRQELDATAFASAVAFIAFSAALCIGRLFAGRVLFGLGPRGTVLIAGCGAALGGLIATASDQPVVVGFAFLLIGFTLSAAAPAGFGLVERSGEEPEAAIMAVTTVGYTGFVWSPPILGWVADTFSLRATMGVVVLATLGVIAGGLFAPGAASRGGTP